MSILIGEWIFRVDYIKKKWIRKVNFMNLVIFMKVI